MKSLLLSVICCITFSLSNAQTILIVDNNPLVDTSPAHMFADFSSAITAAANGDIIYVQPSTTSYGTVTVNKELTIYGLGHTPELNAGRSADFNAMTITSGNVLIAGLNFTNQFSGIAFSGTISNIRIENNRVPRLFYNNGDVDNVTIQGNVIYSGIALSGTVTNTENWTITNNFLTTSSNGLSGFNSTTIFNNNIVHFIGSTSNVVFSNPQDLVAQNNIFIATSSFNGNNWSTGGTPVIFNNNITYSYSGQTLATLNGSGNFDNTNPQFVNIPANNPAFSVDNDYNIGITANGTDGNDAGLFNGSYDFDVRGYPTLLPYISEMTISNNVIQAGQNLNVNLKANANKTN